MTSPRSITTMLCLLTTLPHSAAADGPPATKWQKTQKSISRLIAGSLPMPSGPPRLIIGLEIHIERDWKTYWRHPGDAGGIPPHLDWSRSQNLKSVKVLYPTPKRISDPSGSLIGYKEHVVFPVEVEAADPSRPIRLALNAEFGICQKICNLAQARHALTIRTTKSFTMPPQLYQALEKVPRPERSLRSTDPRLIRVVAKLASAGPKLIFDTAYPNGTRKKIDLFVESLSGSHLPMARKVKSDNTNTARFEIAIPSDIDPKSLVGRALRVTLVSAAGASEFTRTIK